MNNRTFERYDLSNDKWSPIEFEELVKDDVFRMFDNGLPYTDENGKETWIAGSNIHLNEKGEFVITIRQTK